MTHPWWQRWPTTDFSEFHVSEWRASLEQAAAALWLCQLLASYMRGWGQGVEGVGRAPAQIQHVVPCGRPRQA